MRLLAIAFAFLLASCAEVPLSTGDNVEGYEALVESFEADPEKAARFDIFEAQADAIQALNAIERAVTHPEMPGSWKARLKSLANTLTEGLGDYTDVILECPEKDLDGNCLDFDYTNARVLAFRSTLESARAEVVRLVTQGLL